VSTARHWFQRRWQARLMYGHDIRPLH